MANDETVCEVVSGLTEEFKVEKNDFVDDAKWIGEVNGNEVEKVIFFLIEEVAPCVVLAIFIVDGNLEVLKEIELAAYEELFTEVRVATISEVPNVESTEYNGTRVVDVIGYAGLDPFDNDDDMKLVDEGFEIIVDNSDTFVLSLGLVPVLENNDDEDDTSFVDERLLVYAVDVSEDIELIFPDGYDWKAVAEVIALVGLVVVDTNR